MRRRLKALVPGPVAWRKLILTAGAAGLLAAAFLWGRGVGLSQQAAGTTALPGLGENMPGWVKDPNYGRRPVAYIFNSIPITREDLGEYLIARYGPERVEFLVNRRIIDHECQARGVTVTDAEVEAQLVEDLRGMGISRLEDFVNQVLRRFNKTLYEYKEDVIRPRLAMVKLVRPSITITDQDLKDAFEAHHGPKVECRMIVLGKDMNLHVKQELWTKVSKSDEEFDKAAREQFLKPLAATGGVAPPIHRHFGDEQVEREAFGLKPGEVSKLMDMKDGTTVILKCVRHIEPETNFRLEDERLKLHKEVEDVRMLQEIPRYFQKLREQAAAQIFLRRDVTADDVMRRANAALAASARQQVQQPGMPPPPPQQQAVLPRAGAAPAGN